MEGNDGVKRIEELNSHAAAHPRKYAKVIWASAGYR